MRFLQIISLVTLTLLSVPAQAIVQGAVTRDPNGLRRSVVAIENSNGELCSGVLVTQDLVLTAAHCLMDKASYRVMAVNRAFRPQGLNVVAVVVHPAFVAGTTPRTQPGVDLAMLKLERSLGSDFHPLDLRLAGTVDEGATVTVAGFGVLSENLKRTARTLRQVRLLAVGTVQVSNRVMIVADHKRLAETAGAGACRGDSGGPVLTEAQGGYRLFGIVSWSSGALRTNSPSACGGLTAVTPVAEHLSWILDAASKLDGIEGTWTKR
ncbi:S1 family peptidase [Microvirga sp. 2TAF3]|uniref:S1 family peptidase n=1 Tax=Microvirga sp. 2TAF3 TaxID=3233014 RepID=UPI003F9CD67B